MAIIRANAQGTILQFFRDEEEEKRYHADPNGTISIPFDEDSNKALVRQLDTDWNSFSVNPTNSTLLRNGVVVAIAPDGTEAIEKKAVLALKAKIAVGNSDNLSQAEIKRLFRFIFRKLGV